MSESFQPEVIAFCCRHCAYAAADLAGGTRQPYPTAIKIVELPCTGRIDVVTMLHAFEQGADGILVAGCLSGRCHYLKGNLYARQRIEHLGHLLTEIGLEPARARMINISAAMAVQFAQLATEHVDTVRALGPSPLRVSRRNGTGSITAALPPPYPSPASGGGDCCSCRHSSVSKEGTPCSTRPVGGEGSSASNMAGSSVSNVAGSSASDMAGSSVSNVAGSSASNVAGSCASNVAGSYASNMAGSSASSPSPACANHYPHF
jgi:F420-non-reducing hydrogenase iron-sulfur subunit